MCVVLVESATITLLPTYVRGTGRVSNDYTPGVKEIVLHNVALLVEEKLCCVFIV